MGKATWNHRIMVTEKNGVPEFGVHEVHYDDGVPISCTQNSIDIYAIDDGAEDPIDSIVWQLDKIKEATKKPILNYDNFPNEYIKYTRKKKLKQLNKE